MMTKITKKRMMKTLFMLHCSLFMSVALTACMDGGWDESTATASEQYGNNNIRETNLLTIAQLKAKYNTQFTTLGKFAQVKEDTQIKGIVTGNDIQGNLYNEISLQDATGALFIGIAQGGVYGYLPIGTEIVVELNGLYVGNYRKSATIGAYYMSKDGEESVSRMSRHLWMSHFKITGNVKTKEEMKQMATVFADGNNKTTWDINSDAGKLGVLKNVSIRRLTSSRISSNNFSGGYWDGQSDTYVNIGFKDETYASRPDSAKCYDTYAVPNYSTSWYFNEQPYDSQKEEAVQLYNSSYADFASAKLPTGKVNVTGIFKHYCNKQGKNDQWEIIIRSIDDIEPAE